MAIEIEDKQEDMEDMEAACSSMADVIAECLPDGTAFALILSGFTDGSGAAYCSNADRDGMVALLRETADRIEGVGN